MKLFKKAALWLTSIAVTAVACSSCFTAFAEEQGDDFDDEFLSNYIDIVYTNDVHNAYEQTDESVGYAAMAAKVNELKNEKDTDVILVDGGDAIQGGILGALSKGMWAAEIMDKMGYDVAVPGNHEFDFGVERLLEIADSYISYVNKQKAKEEFAKEKDISDDVLDKEFESYIKQEISKTLAVYYK